MTDFFDALEARRPAEREAELMAALPAQIAHAQKHTAAFAEIFKGVDAYQITGRAALAKLPVTRKTDLQDRQKASRAAGLDVFGGFSSLVRKSGSGKDSGMGRIFSSPGPIYEPEGKTADYWRSGRAVFAAGVREPLAGEDAFMRLALSTEGLKTTTRMMHVLAWLLKKLFFSWKYRSPAVSCSALTGR